MSEYLSIKEPCAIDAQLFEHTVRLAVDLTGAADPSLPQDLDARLRREIVQTALKALESEVTGPTLFTPNMAVSG